LTDDVFHVPEREGSATARVDGSRFLAFARPAVEVAAAATYIDGLRKRYHDATHVAFAWRFRSSGATSDRTDDDGEPGGTAGAPILAAIEAAEITNAVVAVVRYFGGTKLGTGGLARAYGGVARAAVAAAGARLCYDRQTLAIDCPYPRLAAVENLLDPPEVEFISRSFGQQASFRLAVRRARVEEILRRLDDAGVSHRLDD
jgi:uncharacterized YigZ family protein